MKRKSTRTGRRADASDSESEAEVGPMPVVEESVVAVADAVPKRARVDGAVVHAEDLHAEDEDGDVGPMPPPPPADSADDDEVAGPLPPAALAASGKPHARKKRKALEHERLYLGALPNTQMYERSFMHRDQITHVATTPRTDFIVTTSADGHLKFWKKTEKGVEFVKHFRGHLGGVCAMAVSGDGLLVATVSAADKSIKVYDVVNFDMINMLKVDYTPRSACWVYRAGQAQALLAVSDANSPAIHLYDGKSEGAAVDVLDTVHAAPVVQMAYNAHAHCVVSVDARGMIEYWVPEVPYELPSPPAIAWEFKTDTDLYEFVKAKAVPSTIAFSPDGSMFATYGLGDRQLRVFKFRTGKLIRKYDESLQVVAEMQQAGTTVHSLDNMEFGRRLAVDRELEQNEELAATVNVVWDESGNFLLYPTLLGVKVVNIHTNNVSMLIGKGETVRFLNIALYQGVPKKKQILSLDTAASDNPALMKGESADPTLFCTSFKKNRFYLFSRREPDSGDTSTATTRDVFNEKPSREEQLAAQPVKKLGTTAILRTTLGDIFLKLYPDFAPKSVENFTTHAKNGYYNGHSFHRIIKGFMIQTGDPTGTGSGGTSIWKGDFADEFNPKATHDKPYTLSMANCGANTNGSQFFITTVPTPWLNNKHTVFGRATAGLDVIHRIENVRLKGEKPAEDVSIINIEVRQD